MQDCSVDGRARVLLHHLDIDWQLKAELLPGFANLSGGLLAGNDLLPGERTCGLDDTINVHVAALLVLVGGPVFAQHFGRECFVLENEVEEGACLTRSKVELGGRHEIADDIALLEGQSVVFAMLGGAWSA